MTTRGLIGDKWSLRILWACAIGTGISIYMVAQERDMQNRARAMAAETAARGNPGGD